MGQIRVARAQALPGHAGESVRASAWQSIVRLSRERSDDVAFLLDTADGVTTRTWAEVAQAVERAAAGLVRSGLRVDQVVVSLLPSDHAHPELDLAMRTIGAVVVHVAPDVTVADLAHHLDGADVRLVVAEDAADLSRLDGVPLPRAALFSIDGGRGWDRLLELGAERLVMDPTAVERADSIVDPDGAGPRLLSGATPIGRAPEGGLRAGVLDPHAVVLGAGDSADALLQVVREAHLDLGFTLCVVEDAARLPGLAAAAHPSVLVVPEHLADAVPDVLAVLAPAVPKARRARAWRAGPDRAQGAAPASARGPLVVTPAPRDDVRSILTQVGGALEVVELADLRAADLPQPPPVVIGDAADLPRRSRRGRGDDFALRLVPEVDASAFLPSLPLMSGESFLDQLLLSRARQAPE
jgi:hypothetical protein